MTLTWIQSFLGYRKQQVEMEGTSSSQASVVSRVHQGTVLGAPLFLAFINDLPGCTSSDTRLFADDSLLYRHIRSNTDAEALQCNLDALEE